MVPVEVRAGDVGGRSSARRRQGQPGQRPDARMGGGGGAGGVGLDADHRVVVVSGDPAQAFLHQVDRVDPPGTDLAGEFVEHSPNGTGQRKRTSKVARPKIFLPSDFALTRITLVRVSGSSDLTFPLNSMSAPSLAGTTAGADSRTA